VHQGEETLANDPRLSALALMLPDELLSLGRVDKLVHALCCVRGWGIRIATVIQSEAQLQAVYGRELAEAFIDRLIPIWSRTGLLPPAGASAGPG